MDGWMDGWIYGRMDGRTDDEWMDGWMDGWMDPEIIGLAFLIMLYSIQQAEVLLFPPL